jgi:hypothetical protein
MKRVSSLMPFPNITHEYNDDGLLSRMNRVRSTVKW